MNNLNDAKTQLIRNQQLFFAILRTVYESEYPISLETIAYRISQPVTKKLTDAITALVISDRLQVHVRDGKVNYQKPVPKPSSLLPLPYPFLFDSF